ncbi:MAG: hypothetical protein ABS89_08335 [Thiobacillus sp. SCN 63-1177]|nr:MAG: hypothetical protein ABS89_08335 [Thiobacillus sp. SCN 63-1177]
MAGQGIAADDARAILQESIEQFESQLAALKAFQPTPGVRSALVSLEGAWNKCRPILASSPSKAGAVALYDVNEELQKTAHSVTLAYEGVTLAPLDHLIGIAGRQRMLSQRMAKFYFYRTWELYDAAADMELHLSRAHFTAVLKQIENSLLASPAGGRTERASTRGHGGSRGAARRTGTERAALDSLTPKPCRPASARA